MNKSDICDLLLPYKHSELALYQQRLRPRKAMMIRADEN
jgi:hypothetical protein